MRVRDDKLVRGRARWKAQEEILLKDGVVPLEALGRLVFVA